MNRLKILTFITTDDHFLLLRNNPSDISHGGDFWFTVTGSVESDETLKQAVKREVKEETSLMTDGIYPLNWGSKYSIDGIEYDEYNFLSSVNQSTVQLNKEHIEYKWLPLGQFVKEIAWSKNKDTLQKVLELGLLHKNYFNKITFEIF